jgi:hypothetical protein
LQWLTVQVDLQALFRLELEPGFGGTPALPTPRRYAAAHEPREEHGRERIAENAAIFDFSLSDGEMTELDALDRTGGTDQAQEHKWW